MSISPVLSAPPCRVSRAAPIVLVSHGSRDPRSAATMRRLAAAAGARWPAPVAAAFLDFNLPSVPWALRGFGAHGDLIAVPALLTRAYHGRVDVPAVLAQAGVPARVTPVLGPSVPGEDPSPLLIGALKRRLAGLTGYDGIVLIAAGTTDHAALSTVEHTADVLGSVAGLPCVAGYASGAGRTGGEAVTELRRRGSRRPVVSSYFFATGRLHRAVLAAAREAGAIAAAEPLGDAPELVELILDRARGV